VESVEVFVTKLTPERLDNSLPGTVIIEGAGFQPSNQVALVSGGATYPASDVLFNSNTRLEAQFDFTAIPLGNYQLRVTTDGNSAALPFDVVAASQGSFHA